MGGSVVETEVVIAGAGPVGMALSIVLSNLGIANVVVERGAGIHPLPRAAVIDAEVQQAFITHGLGEELAPLLTPMKAADYVDANGNVLVGGDVSRVSLFGGLPAASFHFQPEIDALFLRELRARGAGFMPETPFNGVEQGADGVRLLLEDGGAVSGRWLVGCDGASSTIRRAVGIDREDLGFEQDWLVVDMRIRDRAGSGLPDVARQICDPVRPVTMISCHRDVYRWEFQLQPGEDPKEMNQPEHVWRLLAPWVNPSTADIIRSASYRFHGLVATTFRAGNVFLAGDAAHQMPPFMGQGLNSGWRDAFNLVWKMRWVHDGFADDRLLDTYNPERIHHSRVTVERSIEAGQLIDQFAGRVSHGIKPGKSYGSGTARPRYEAGAVAGDHPRTGTVFDMWHLIGGDAEALTHMTVVSANDRTPALPVRGLWRSVALSPMETLGADHVVVRPDGFMAAICDDAAIDATLPDLCTRMGC
jgi:3-(3-hydroxy-phenyl)propionate hydroxylase